MSFGGHAADMVSRMNYNRSLINQRKYKQEKILKTYRVKLKEIHIINQLNQLSKGEFEL